MFGGHIRYSCCLWQQAFTLNPFPVCVCGHRQHPLISACFYCFNCYNCSIVSIIYVISLVTLCFDCLYWRSQIVPYIYSCQVTGNCSLIKLKSGIVGLEISVFSVRVQLKSAGYPVLIPSSQSESCVFHPILVSLQIMYCYGSCGGPIIT